MRVKRYLISSICWQLCCLALMVPPYWYNYLSCGLKHLPSQITELISISLQSYCRNISGSDYVFSLLVLFCCFSKAFLVLCRDFPHRFVSVLNEGLKITALQWRYLSLSLEVSLNHLNPLTHYEGIFVFSCEETLMVNFQIIFPLKSAFFTSEGSAPGGVSLFPILDMICSQFS